ncbi:MAG: hypothetical protein Q8910_01915 [Bacteroidota bacterium]|nr:hypothetical protein [Bacteroidota bacterium]MDP4225118.1 hypothetical protein [Bacteroidota bacterium]
MKTTVKFRERSRKPERNLSRIMLIMLMMMCCYMNANAQKHNETISISGTSYTYPLIEKWISEYSKYNPEVNFKLVKNPGKNEKIDLKIITSTQNQNEVKNTDSLVIVGEVALLPITSKKNQGFSKQFKKGFKQQELKDIFLKKEEEVWEEDAPKNKIKYTVYTKSPQSSSAQILSKYFGKPANNLKGVIVAGDDKYLINSVLKDSTGVAYNSLGLVYDLTNRLPVNGIKVLPIDLNNNGRLEKNEEIYDNLDQVISYLENNPNKSIPTDVISFVYAGSENQEVGKFVNWVKNSGQNYNHLYGFLKNSNESLNVLTVQK